MPILTFENNMFLLTMSLPVKMFYLKWIHALIIPNSVSGIIAAAVFVFRI
jgi:hypothetical protein